MDNFDHWFSTATKGLAQEEVKLLLPELRNHYEDTLQHHLGNGQSATDASAKAVASLGDPKQCNRQYRQLYFSESEYKSLFTPAQQNLIPSAFVVGMASVALVVVTIRLIYSVVVEKGNPDLGGFLMVLTLSLIFASLYLIARHCPSLRWPGPNKVGAPLPQPLPLASISPPEIAALRLSHILLLLSVITLTLMVANWSWGFAGAIFGPLYFLFFLSVLTMFIPIIRKLSRFGRDGQRSA
jgi:hypothetical protein